LQQGKPVALKVKYGCVLSTLLLCIHGFFFYNRYVTLLMQLINPSSENDSSVFQEVTLAGCVSPGCVSKGR